MTWHTSQVRRFPVLPPHALRWPRLVRLPLLPTLHASRPRSRPPWPRWLRRRRRNVHRRAELLEGCAHPRRPLRRGHTGAGDVHHLVFLSPGGAAARGRASAAAARLAQLRSGHDAGALGVRPSRVRPRRDGDLLLLDAHREHPEHRACYEWWVLAILVGAPAPRGSPMKGG